MKLLEEENRKLKQLVADLERGSVVLGAESQLPVMATSYFPIRRNAASYTPTRSCSVARTLIR